MGYVETLFNYICCEEINSRMTVSDELERMWKELVVAYFKTVYHHLPGVNEENHEK
jgi:hypothetical protein